MVEEYGVKNARQTLERRGCLAGDDFREMFAVFAHLTLAAVNDIEIGGLTVNRPSDRASTSEDRLPDAGQYRRIRSQ